MIEELFNVNDELTLFQIVKETTHKDGNILDLVFTNNKELIHSYQCILTLNTISHYSIVEVELFYECGKHHTKMFRISQNEFEVYNYFSYGIDWNSVNAEMQSL